MGQTMLADTMSRKDFDAVLARYDSYVPEDLEMLDKFRFEDLPKTIVERVSNDSTASNEVERVSLEKEEIVKLVEWKLKHGIFRPRLLQLVKSNDAKEFQRVIQLLSEGDKTAKEKMKNLTELKGIGPATASLILSCINPTRYVFFSDELFKLIHWDGQNADGTTSGIKGGVGWQRPIGYTQKEYDSLLVRCLSVQDRLSDKSHALNFLDLEKVAYVLGKEKVDVTAENPSRDGENPVLETTVIAPKRDRSADIDAPGETQNKRRKSGSKAKAPARTASRPTRKNT